MGSVGPNYRCPLCGRVGNGGYVGDGVAYYPICTEGNYSCLWFQVQEHSRSPAQVLGNAVQGILKTKEARFRMSPVSQRLEVFIVNFHFCGEYATKEVLFEPMLPETKLFSGYHQNMAWCTTLRVRPFEKKSEWLKWVCGLPVMVREHDVEAYEKCYSHFQQPPR